MAHSEIEFFKVNEEWVVPVEFRFIRCKIVFSDQAKETCHWMNETLWKELCQTAASILKTHDFSKDVVESAPSLLTTSHLRLAYIFKENDFKRRTVLESTGKENRDLKSFHNSKRMLVISVSLDSNQIPLHELRTALPQSQFPSEDGPKISNYFTTKSVPCEHETCED